MLRSLVGALFLGMSRRVFLKELGVGINRLSEENPYTPVG